LDFVRPHVDADFDIADAESMVIRDWFDGVRVPIQIADIERKSDVLPAIFAW
jgi:hypothetical protein